MIILGFDPGINKCGYGIISKEGSRILHVENGLILTRSRGNYFDKLNTIFRKTTEIIETFKPELICLETAFYAKNIHSTIMLASARTAAILAFTMRDIKIAEYSPREVKKSICGNGNASKSQIQEMVKILLNLPDVPYEDAADALAIALSGAFRGASQ